MTTQEISTQLDIRQQGIARLRGEMENDAIGHNKVLKGEIWSYTFDQLLAVCHPEYRNIYARRMNELLNS